MSRPRDPTFQEPEVHGLTRWLLPTLNNLSVLSVLYFILTQGQLLSDSDTGWHIRTGDLVRASGAVPRLDPFSFTMPEREWFAWEWLADLVMSWVHSTTGLAGIVAAAMLILCATYALVQHWMVARGANPLLATFLTAFAALISIVHWLARPHLASIALMLVSAIVIEDFRCRRSRWIYAVPLLTAIWANLHGAFVLTFLTLAIYACGEFVEFSTNGNRANGGYRSVFRTYALIGVLSAGSSLLTPYGWNLHQHIWEYLGDSALLPNIQEFQSPNFHTTQGRLIEILLLLGLGAAIQAARNRRWVDIALLIFWAHLTLQSVRHVTLAAVVMLPIIAEHWSGLLSEMADLLATGQSVAARRWRAARNWSRGIVAMDQSLSGLFVNVAVVFVCAGVASGWGDRLVNTRFDPNVYPVEAAEFIVDAGLGSDLYSHDRYGSYLIYRFYPEIKVFVDGRSDFYRSGEVLDDFGKLLTIDPSWSAILAKYGVRSMLLRLEDPLALLAEQSGEWTEAYRDATARVFVRAEFGPE